MEAGKKCDQPGPTTPPYISSARRHRSKGHAEIILDNFIIVRHHFGENPVPDFHAALREGRFVCNFFQVFGSEVFLTPRAISSYSLSFKSRICSA